MRHAKPEGAQARSQRVLRLGGWAERATTGYALFLSKCLSVKRMAFRIIYASKQSSELSSALPRVVLDLLSLKGPFCGLGCCL